MPHISRPVANLHAGIGEHQPNGKIREIIIGDLVKPVQVERNESQNQIGCQQQKEDACQCHPTRIGMPIKLKSFGFCFFLAFLFFLFFFGGFSAAGGTTGTVASVSRTSS